LSEEFPEFHKEISTGAVFAILHERIEVKDGKTFIVANIGGDTEAGMRYLQAKAEMYEKIFKDKLEELS